LTDELLDACGWRAIAWTNRRYGRRFSGGVDEVKEIMADGLWFRARRARAVPEPAT